MADRTKCRACGGWGYHPCECWPGDCICGFGDEPCEDCEGTGFIGDDDDYYPDELERPTPTPGTAREAQAGEGGA